MWLNMSAVSLDLSVTIFDATYAMAVPVTAIVPSKVMPDVT
jgi:hypothetical protein